MKNKKLIYTITCCLGSGMIGFFSNSLNQISGSIFFTVGVILMVLGVIKLNK